ncbi:guanylate cyclase D isoform X2 [Phymastichus coffea]|uniref:guanylate cyclase D isoform X2 n=1 Tax=Phymastichus coffea TaxID=108790 RepID=UPI00273B4584|nr:guanylate cyclase D isoform X2 [Phymastichus coffea]
MARCWWHQRWWWLLLVLISRLACGQYPVSSTTTTVPRQQRVVVFLREQCDGDQNTTELLRQLAHGYTLPPLIDMVPKDESCEERSWGLEGLVQALSRKTTRAMLAQLDYNTCEVVAKLAHLWNKPLVTWTCPQRTEEDRKLSSVVRLSPSPVVLGRSLAEIFLHFRWKSVSVIGVDTSPWSMVDRSVIAGLRTIGVIPRHHAVLPTDADTRQIRAALTPLRAIPCRAIVVCLPLEGELLSQTLVELDTMQDTRLPSVIIVLVTNPPGPQPFLPTISDLQSDSYVASSNETMTDKTDRRFVPPRDLSRTSLDNLLAIVPFDQRYDVARLLNGSSSLEPETTIDHLREALDFVLDINATRLNSFNNKMYTYGLLSYTRDNGWRPLVVVIEYPDSLVLKELANNNFADEEVFDLLCDDQSDCPVENIPGISLHTVHIVAIILGSLLFALTAIITAALIRRHLLKKRMSKGPYKIILTATDFVFPQIPDARRVDEGIEAMLCCWLQQLQEFGGPEVEKPDLLQGSVGSLRPHLQASNGNLARHLFNDPRARYNGDLVQLKQLPVQGAFELKSKAMDVLVTIHGLRHENLNPLIGCLTEPSRPCLVYEYCSRGSLEDVLVQDEIKLDWSFRLSLLTDLVRGMKYLHSTPIRTHGYLTSRNCVIDARWVLKVTDYGLPAFYEAQNVQSSSKTARDLLWTAPELLRHTGLRKRGSQPGDVYSFGIIMQEVVVRGEPFCMFALSPEDIIEKVKKPPPLIRPSVSKGAAPPEAINIMRQCWAENADMRPDFNNIYELFKKLNHGRKVNFVDTMFQMLEKYSNNLEELIRERTEQLDMEKKKTEQLLNRMLPSSVADKLKLGNRVDPEEFGEVTIYFSDIVGFTTISAYSTPFQVVDLLNDLYTCFDATINAYNVYKVETIGDAYMVVGGCPVRIPDHASQVATMALDLLHQSGKFKLKHLPRTQLRLRIGLHTGPCCAGVVGLTMPRYCLFGDTVNTASRMESTGVPWRIHMSQATRDKLTQAGGYIIEYRGPTEVKGKGTMNTYWLLGKQDFDKELPVPPPLGLDENIIIENLQSSEQQAEAESSNVPIQVSTHLTTLNSTEEDSSAEVSATVSLHATGTASPSKYALSEQSSIEKPSSSRRVPVSVHDNLSSNEPFKVDTTGTRSTSDYSSANVTKSTSTDNPVTLGTPVSATEVAAALLGASSTSINSMTSNVFSRNRPRRMGGVIDEDDLSTPYNHYRCLSPNEHYGKATFEQQPEKSLHARRKLGRSRIKSLDIECGLGATAGRGRLLRRQFSLDRADEPSTSTTATATVETQQHRTAPRLFKQNSAGAANDLERIEEVPSTPGAGQAYRHSASVSLSVESLTLR